MGELDVVYDRDCGRYGKIRVTEGTITVGTKTFPKTALADFDVRPPRLLSRDGLVAVAAAVFTLLWIVIFAVVMVKGEDKGDGGHHRLPPLATAICGLITLGATTFTGNAIRRARRFYWFTIRTTGGERLRARFFGPDPEIQSLFEEILAGKT